MENVSADGWGCTALMIPVAGGYGLQFEENDWALVAKYRGQMAHLRRRGRVDEWTSGSR